ncbi:NusG domain II-containing protein, partial [Dysosmobacter sp.]|uniref:NusG domain II-containing protein n=1 Tax=Dysosmobacter sp. TaxID=2591382 RepID=UPI002A988F8A
MKSSPKLRPGLWDGLVVLLVLVLAAACALAVWNRSNDAGDLTAIVTVDGTEAERIPLKDFPDLERTYSGNGYTLRVSLSPEGSRVEEADCPTQDCVHTGTITRAGQS